MSVLASDLRTVAHEAYVYLYPLVTMELTRRQLTNLPAGSRPGVGPANRFHHIRQFPDADFRAVVRPNFDTLYSSAWLDLTRGPVRIQVPDSGDRYYMLPMLDMWTDVFANPGKRTTGTAAQDFVVVPPGWSGGLPDAATRIDAPTPHVWVIGRTQTNGPADYGLVNEFQDGWRIVELGDPVGDAIDTGVDTETEPLRQVNEMSAAAFFTLGAELLKSNGPHATDFSQLARMAMIGIVPGTSFDPDAFDAAQLAELDAGVANALALIMDAPHRLGHHVNGWTIAADGMGVYGNTYADRAMVTLVGLGANPVEDAVYPLLLSDADGDPTIGDTDYVIHFATDALPPVDAFWSVTMYDAEGFQVANELDRFAIGDRDPLVFNTDGSLDLYLQKANPGPDREANWLPAPSGPVGVTMRLYAPRPEVLDGRWAPPAVRKA